MSKVLEESGMEFKNMEEKIKKNTSFFAKQILEFERIANEALIAVPAGAGKKKKTITISIKKRFEVPPIVALFLKQKQCFIVAKSNPSLKKYLNDLDAYLAIYPQIEEEMFNLKMKTKELKTKELKTKEEKKESIEEQIQKIIPHKAIPQIPDYNVAMVEIMDSEGPVIGLETYFLIIPVSLASVSYRDRLGFNSELMDGNKFLKDRSLFTAEQSKIIVELGKIENMFSIVEVDMIQEGPQMAEPKLKYRSKAIFNKERIS